MGIDVEKRSFRSRAEVYDVLEATGFWPTTLVSGPSPGREVHWHSHDVHADVIDGHTSFLDAESGEDHPVEAGDKVVVPARALHAEGRGAAGIADGSMVASLALAGAMQGRATRPNADRVGAERTLAVASARARRVDARADEVNRDSAAQQ